MLLAIDAGNSFVKLAYHDGQAWRRQQRIPLAAFVDEAKRLSEEPGPGQIIISNVAGDAFAVPAQHLLDRWGKSAVWVSAQPAACGVVNSYARPEQLGSDRWAALIAARALYKSACVVASVGTAVTIDVMNGDGVFVGGVILPGIHVMQESLYRATAGVAVGAGQYVPFPRNTADGVYSGTLQAIAGAVERMARVAAGVATDVKIVVTGGAAGVIAPLLTPAPAMIPDLVLEGLLHIARTEDCA